MSAVQERSLKDSAKPRNCQERLTPSSSSPFPSSFSSSSFWYYFPPSPPHAYKENGASIMWPALSPSTPQNPPAAAVTTAYLKVDDAQRWMGDGRQAVGWRRGWEGSRRAPLNPEALLAGSQTQAPCRIWISPDTPDNKDPRKHLLRLQVPGSLLWGF